VNPLAKCYKNRSVHWRCWLGEWPPIIACKNHAQTSAKIYMGDVEKFRQFWKSKHVKQKPETYMSPIKIVNVKSRISDINSHLIFAGNFT